MPILFVIFVEIKMAMTSHGIVDIASGCGLLLFTGGIISEVEVLQAIGSMGVPAILYFWLNDTKKQMKELTETFAKEQQNTRTEHKEHIEEIKTMFSSYKDRLETNLQDREKIIKLYEEKSNN